MTLPMFTLIDLPKNFLDLIHPPYSAPILECNEGEGLLCLLTGKTILISSFNSMQKVKDYIDKEFKGTFSIFLRLNGSYASEVVIINREFDFVLNVSSFYTDKFDDPDIGIKNCSLLTMNELNKEEIIDKFLSGLWTNTISI